METVKVILSILFYTVGTIKNLLDMWRQKK